MSLLCKYFFFPILAMFYMAIYTMGCGGSNHSNNDDSHTNSHTTTSNVSSPTQNRATANTNNDTFYIIRDKKQQKRILYVDKNNQTTLMTLMSPETFCLKIKKIDFNHIQKIALSSDIKNIDQLLCSNEPKSNTSNAVPNCEVKNYRITNLYQLESLDLNDASTMQLIKKDYDPFCFEFFSW